MPEPAEAAAGQVTAWRAHLPAPAYGWVTYRRGGVSQPPWDSLNLAYHVRDEPSAVAANRQRAQVCLALPAAGWITAEQVHRHTVAWVGQRPPQTGSGELAVLRGVDGLVSPLTGQPLALFFADCVPLLFATSGLVGVAHAGWRGTWLGIAREMVEAFVRGGGRRAQDLWVSLGPAVGPCCYTVSPALWEAFRQRWGASVAPRPHALDLRAANVQWLRGCGVPASHIDICTDCTSCRGDRYFSHRRDGFPTGRMAAIVGQEPIAWQGSAAWLPNPPRG